MRYCPVTTACQNVINDIGYLSSDERNYESVSGLSNREVCSIPLDTYRDNVELNVYYDPTNGDWDYRLVSDDEKYDNSISGYIYRHIKTKYLYESSAKSISR